MRSYNEEAQQLAERLNAMKSAWPSEPSLRTLSQGIVDALMKRFAEIERTTIPVARKLALFFTFLPLGLALIELLHPGSHSLYRLAVAILVPIPVIAGLYVVGSMVHSVHGGMSPYTVYALTQTDDVRVLETLILATRYKWGRDPEVIRAINRLLEQVTEADAGLLSDRAQHRLWTIGIAWQTLAAPYDPQVAIRVLRTLAAVGNRATLARMERFAYRSEHFIDERYAIAAARELLPVVRARLQRQAVPATLLRASNAHPQTLLRAVQVTTPEPTAQLLRASTSEHPEHEA